MRVFLPLLLTFGFLILSLSVKAGGVDWRGQYRFEYFDVSSTDLNEGGAKAAFLNRLNLRPQIIAADGLRVITNMEVLSNSLYPNDQVGAWFGSSVQNDQLARRQQAASQFAVREAYLRWEQEHAELIVGRAPFHFGMGTFYNSGMGAFDHFSDNYDMISYKIYVGNLLIEPILTTIQDKSIQRSGGANDQMIHLFYDNQDAKAQFEILYRNRTAPTQNEILANRPSLYNEAAIIGDYKVNFTHLYFARYWETFSFKLEGGVESGPTGLQAANLDPIELGGFGVSLELEFKPVSSIWDYKILTGVVSGDDPTTSKYEGFQLHRNYDIAFLLGNHPMGRYDVLTSNRQRTRNQSSPFALLPNDSVLDEETVGNMIYFAPQFNRALSDRWKWTNRIALAQTQVKASTQSGVSSELGWEYDIGLKYQPYERFQWVTELGVFSPGQAFAEGALGHPTKMVWGWQTRAAVDF
jgi:hypothetical protein